MNYNNTGKEKEIKQNKHYKTGLYSVKLSKNNKAKDFMVARLVAESFLNNKNNKPIVMHKGNINDNSIENIKYAYICESKFNTYKKGNRKIGQPSGNIISYKNKRYKKLSDLARDYNIEPKNFFKRIENGWTLDEVLTIKVDIKNRGGKPYYYDYYGKLMTVKQIAKLNNIDAKLINKRLGYGWNIYEAAEIKKGNKNG